RDDFCRYMEKRKILGGKMLRYRLGVMLFLMVFVGPRVVRARDAVIGEKNLPTEHSVEEPSVSAQPKSSSKKKVEAGYDKGFFIQSSDGNYKLKITSYV